VWSPGEPNEFYAGMHKKPHILPVWTFHLVFQISSAAG
jgi:hypothetical protein